MRSLNEFVIEGVTTTVDLHKRILSHEKFVSSDFDTNWLAKEKFYWLIIKLKNNILNDI